MAIKPDKRAITNEQAAVMPCWKHTIVPIATQQLSKHCSTTSPNLASNSHCPQRCCGTTLPSHSFPTKHTCTRGFSPPRGLLNLPACLGSGLASEQQRLSCLLQPFTEELAPFLPFSSTEPFFERGPDSAAQQTKHQRPLLAARCHRGWPLSQGSVDKQSQSELTYVVWGWKARRRLTGSCPILRPADSLPVPLLRPMSPQAAGAMPREISLLSPPPDNSGLDNVSRKEKGKGIF